MKRTGLLKFLASLIIASMLFSYCAMFTNISEAVDYNNWWRYNRRYSSNMGFLKGGSPEKRWLFMDTDTSATNNNLGDMYCIVSGTSQAGKYEARNLFNLENMSQITIGNETFSGQQLKERLFTNEANYTRFMWILEHMYVNQSDDRSTDDKIEASGVELDAFNSFIGNSNVPYNREETVTRPFEASDLGRSGNIGSVTLNKNELLIRVVQNEILSQYVKQTSNAVTDFSKFYSFDTNRNGTLITDETTNNYIRSMQNSLMNANMGNYSVQNSISFNTAAKLNEFKITKEGEAEANLSNIFSVVNPYKGNVTAIHVFKDNVEINSDFEFIDANNNTVNVNTLKSNLTNSVSNAYKFRVKYTGNADEQFSIRVVIDVDYGTITQADLLVPPNFAHQFIINVKRQNVRKSYSAEGEVEVEKIFDLALTKDIIGIKNASGTVRKLRYHHASTDRLNIDAYGNRAATSATYMMKKEPVYVEKGDVVIYRIGIYNEGQIEGYAKEITDYLPEGVSFIEDSQVNRENGWVKDSENDRILTTKIKQRTNLAPYAGREGQTLFDQNNYTYIYLECRVNDDAPEGVTLDNKAEITKYGYYDEIHYFVEASQPGIDEDSKQRSAMNDASAENISELIADIPTRIAEKITNARYNPSELSDKNIIAYEDDEDIERLIVAQKPTIFDLALRKWIVSVNEKEYPEREPDVFKAYNNESADNEELVNKLNQYKTELIDNDKGTLEYNHAKNAVVLKRGDIVKYRIGIFNEGEVDGYAKEITDFLPQGLELVTNDPINIANGWEEVTGISNSNVKIIRTTKFADTSSEENIIYSLPNAVANIGTKKAVKVLEVVCRVTDDAVSHKNITNRAEITDYGYISNGDYVAANDEGVDIDSEQNTIKDDLDLDNWHYDHYDVTSPQSYLPGVQDDDDFETVWIRSEAEYSVRIKKVSKDEDNKAIAGAIFAIKPAGSTEEAIRSEATNTEGITSLIASKKIMTGTEELFDITEVSVPDPYVAYDGIIKLSVAKIDKDGKYVLDAQNTKLVNAASGVSIEIDEIGSIITITVPNTKQTEKIFDLSLRKFITEINGTEVETSREPKVDVSKLASKEATTATYTHPKDVLQVATDDVVTYTVRVYNEGEVDGYASQIMDDIPEGVEFLPENQINKNYRWVMYKEAADSEESNAVTFDDKKYVVTDNAKEAKIIVTDYLAKNDSEENLLKAFDGEKLSYKDLKIAFKVVEPGTSERVITNYAQITKHCDKDGDETVVDRDSTPNKWVDGEDDQDIENIKVKPVKEFDFALRKFITKINGEKVKTSREPKVDVSKLASGEETTATYTHTKEPLLVNPTDIVEYTLRIYNECEAEGYASLVIDNIPDGVTMVAPSYDDDGKPLNQNAEYRWKMYKEVSADSSDVEVVKFADKFYVETDRVDDAVIIATDYLSKENGESNLIKAFDGKKLDYKDIKVQYLVNPSKDVDRIITNFAQISEYQTPEGTPVVDRDSTPNKWVDGEDDQDVEHIKVTWFDLALYKWVSSAIVTEDGKTVEYDSKHTAKNKNNIVNVTIPKDKLNSTVVKFKWKIRVENQSVIEGYAQELKDHIPEGLKFVAEDNVKYGWVLEKDGTVTTDYLKNTLLKPGETAEVELVLTWVNGKDNLGEKVNMAEISKDYNEYGAPDIDSTPNNLKEKPVEDDEDLDSVRLNVRTGIEINTTYIAIGVGVLTILATGIVLIKKFVK